MTDYKPIGRRDQTAGNSPRDLRPDEVYKPWIAVPGYYLSLKRQKQCMITLDLVTTDP